MYCLVFPGKPKEDEFSLCQGQTSSSDNLYSRSHFVLTAIIKLSPRVNYRCIMKRLFSLASRPSRRSDLPSVPQTSLSKSTVPPHLYPHEYIAVIASEDGLLMRPYTPGPDQPEPYVRVSWGKECKVEALVGDGVTNWASSVLIYGVIGILDSFNGMIDMPLKVISSKNEPTASYLLVITARQDVGCCESLRLLRVLHIEALIPNHVARLST